MGYDVEYFSEISDSDLVERAYYVYETQSSFETCPSCKRIYWDATHKERMVKHIEEILREISL